jgi:hypothetical protein
MSNMMLLLETSFRSDEAQSCREARTGESDKCVANAGDGLTARLRIHDTDVTYPTRRRERVAPARVTMPESSNHAAAGSGTGVTCTAEEFAK